MVVADESKIQQEPNSCYRWNKRGNTPVVKVNRERKAVSIYGGLSRITKRVITHFCRWQESVETIAFLNKIKGHSNRLRKAQKRARANSAHLGRRDVAQEQGSETMAC